MMYLLATGASQTQGTEMSTNTVQTTTEFVAAQVVMPAWMQEVADEAGPEGSVRVTRKVTPFGTFVVGAVAV